MLARQAADRPRLAEEAADQVDVVDRVVLDLEPRRFLQEVPELPGRVHRDPRLHRVKLADGAALDQLAREQAVGREAQLVVDGGHQALGAAAVADGAGAGEVLAHRLLEQDRGAVRELLQGAEQGTGREGEVEDRVRGRSGDQVGDVRGDAGNSEVGREGLGLGRDQVADGREGEARLAVGGQVSAAGDAAGAGDADRAGAVGERPALAGLGPVGRGHERQPRARREGLRRRHCGTVGPLEGEWTRSTGGNRSPRRWAGRPLCS